MLITVPLKDVSVLLFDYLVVADGNSGRIANMFLKIGSLLLRKTR